MFSDKSDKRIQREIIQECIEHYHTNKREFRTLTLDSEYQTLIGKEYDELRKHFGDIVQNTEHLRQADITSVKELYTYGSDKQKVIDTVMRRSPASRQMSQGDRKKYAKKLEKAMNTVERERHKIQRQKETYGVETNCKRDIENYLKCMKAERKARSHGMMIPHLNYREFQKKTSPNYHKKYIADIEAKTAKQKQIDRERQKEKQQQMEQSKQIKRSR